MAAPGTGFFRNIQATLREWVENNIIYSLQDVDVSVQMSCRKRLTIAQVNAGAILLPAIPGFKYRVIDWSMISNGGAAAGATTVDILGTLAASSRKIGAAAVAGLTQSTVLRAGAANATVLADGASFTANDVNTAITANKTGGALTTSVTVDFFVEYVVEKA